MDIKEMKSKLIAASVHHGADCSAVDVGDAVVRVIQGISGAKEMDLVCVGRDADTIVLEVEGNSEIGQWYFHPGSGSEIDPTMEWGAPPLVTGSYIKSWRKS